MIKETRRIPCLYTYLKQSAENEIVIRATLVNGDWHDIEFDAHAAGFAISVFQDPALIAQNKFPECYRLVRK